MNVEVQKIAEKLTPGERSLILIVGAVQFVNILDFMMVMPLGPDFARALHVPTSMIGAVGGAYTAAAAVAGLVCSLFLDRFERRRTLTVLMLGLAVATVLGGFTWDLPSLLASRVLAGVFGGPATSVSLAIVTDAVPPSRRGKAMGQVMAAFSVASIIGVPTGLELARHFGFRVPFFAVGALSLVVTLFATRLLPEMRDHLRTGPRQGGPFLSSIAWVSLTNTAVTMLGVFSIVPNIAAFLQFNLGYPREALSTFYLVGGIASFFAMRLVGSWVDRVGAIPLILLGTAFHVFALLTGFIHPTKSLPVLFVFTIYMLSGSVRMVPIQTLASRIPEPNARARFMSAQSSVQHLASATGAFMSSAFLRAEPSGRLIGLDRIAQLSLGLALLGPILASIVNGALRRRDASAVAEAA